MTRWGGKDPEMSNLGEIKVRVRSLVPLQPEAKAWTQPSSQEEAWTVRKMYWRQRPERKGKPGEGLRKHLPWPSSQWGGLARLVCCPRGQGQGPSSRPPGYWQEIGKQEKSLPQHMSVEGPSVLELVGPHLRRDVTSFGNSIASEECLPTVHLGFKTQIHHPIIKGLEQLDKSEVSL